MKAAPKDKLDTWFSEPETQELIKEIITKIQICHIQIGNTDDQLLLMYLLKDISEK